MVQSGAEAVWSAPVSNPQAAALVGFGPFHRKSEGFRREVSFEDTEAIDGDNCLILIIHNVKMRRIMIVKIHLDQNAVETAYRRHERTLTTRFSVVNAGTYPDMLRPAQTESRCSAYRNRDQQDLASQKSESGSSRTVERPC